MREQGYDTNQVIQALQRDGFSSSDIFDAMSQADLHPSDPVPSQPSPEPSFREQIAPQYGQQQYGAPMPAPSSMQYSQGPGTEELIEAIIEEKWSALAKDIQKIVEWKNRMDTKLQIMDQDVKALQDQFARMQEAMLGKLSEYDRSVSSVGADVKAMQKAFSDVLPEFSRGVSQLSDIAKTLKTKK
jgi:DNA-binding transcriptional MerR regulator